MQQIAEMRKPSFDIEGECSNRIFKLGDFNRLALTETLPNLQKYIDCTTRFSSTLDLCYGNIEDAYQAVCRASLVMLSIYLQNADKVCNTSPLRQVAG